MRGAGRDDIIFALGPAGTGKTYLAVAQAVSQLISGSVQRLILSRPAVEAGERLGFLPGDMKDKVDPYLRPLYDALYDCMPPEQVERRMAAGEIEIAPIAFMRGRTLADAFIILDEAQNTTPRADEDVPDPLRPEQPDGGLRRSQAGRHSRRRRHERAWPTRSISSSTSKASPRSVSVSAMSCVTRSSGGSWRPTKGRGR